MKLIMENWNEYLAEEEEVLEEGWKQKLLMTMGLWTALGGILNTAQAGQLELNDIAITSQMAEALVGATLDPGAPVGQDLENKETIKLVQTLNKIYHQDAEGKVTSLDELAETNPEVAANILKVAKEMSEFTKSLKNPAVGGKIKKLQKQGGEILSSDHAGGPGPGTQ